MATKLQQYQISGSLASDIDDGIKLDYLVGENRTVVDDLNSIRSQVKRILGSGKWTDEQSTSLVELTAKLGLDSTDNISIGGELAVMNQATLQSLNIEEQSGKDGAIVVFGKSGHVDGDLGRFALSDSTLLLGDINGSGGAAGAFVMYDMGGTKNVQIVSENSSLTMGRDGASGRIFLKGDAQGNNNTGVEIASYGDGGYLSLNKDGKSNMYLEAASGYAEFGGQGVGGKVILRDGDGNARVIAGTESIVMRNDGGHAGVELTSNSDAAGSLKLYSSERNGIPVIELNAKGHAMVGSFNRGGILQINNELGNAVFSFNTNHDTSGSFMMWSPDRNEQVAEIAGDGSAMFAGDVKLYKNLTVSGDLTVSGTTTTIDTQNLIVEDPVVVLGKGSPGNVATGVVLGGAAWQGADLVIGSDASVPDLGDKFIVGKGSFGPTGNVDFSSLETVEVVTSGLRLASSTNQVASQGLSGYIYTNWAPGEQYPEMGIQTVGKLYFTSYGTLVNLADDWTQLSQFNDQFGSGTSLIGALLTASGGASSGAFSKVQRKGTSVVNGTFDFSAEMGGKKLRADDYSTTARDLDVYLNGMLLALNHPEDLVAGDYSMDGKGAVHFNFTVNADDVITVVLRNSAVDAGGGAVPA